MFPVSPCAFLPFIFPHSMAYVPSFFFARQQFFAAAQSVLAGQRGGTAGAFHAVLAYCFVSTFFAASALRIRGSTDSACGRCAWLRLSTCAIFLSRLIRLIQGLVCCVRYPKKVYPPGSRMAIRRILLWYEDLALDGGLAFAQRHSRFAAGIPTATHSTT